jgi:hypothetical protein
MGMDFFNNVEMQIREGIVTSINIAEHSSSEIKDLISSHKLLKDQVSFAVVENNIEYNDKKMRGNDENI